tara:strand:+ start:1520 stop:3061 length:1542 start_codon:yes stop_codon:yes gene_type:complete
MLNSPLKTVVDKIKPVKSKSTVSSLKFERSSDFKKLIRFIKDETEELEKIKLPTKSDIEPKSETPFLGLLGIGAFGGLLALFGGDKENKKKARIPSFGGGAKLAIQSRALGGRSNKTFRDLMKRKKVDPRVARVKKIYDKIFNRKSKAEVKKNPVIVKLKTGLSILKENKNKLIKIKDKLIKEKIRITKNLNRMKNEGFTMTDGFYMDEFIRRIGVEADIRDISDKIKTLTDREDRQTKEIQKIKKILTKDLPFNKKNLGAIREMLNEKSSSQFLKDVRIDPRFKDIEKFIKSMDPLAFDPTKIPSFKIPFFKDRMGANFRFTPRELIDDAATSVGKFTKPLRKKVSGFGKSFMKSKKPMFGIKTGIKGVRFLFSSKVSFATMLAGLLFDSYDIIKNRDDPFTGLYNVFVEYNNTYGAGKGDPTKLRVFKGRRTTATMGFASQDFVDKVNAARDRENQEILKRRNAAIEANKNNQPDLIIPFKMEADGQSLINMSITPSNTQSKILGSKLNKQ